MDFPSAVKQRFVAVRLRGLLATFAGGEIDRTLIADLVDTLDPFDRPEAEATGDETSFDPFKPRLGSLDGGVDTKVGQCLSIFATDVLSGLIGRGEGGASITSMVAQAVLDRVEEKLEDIDPVPQAVEHLLDMCRALLAILDPCNTDPDFEAVSSLVLAGKKSCDSPLGSLGVLMQAEPFYKDLVDGFMAAIVTSKENLPGLASMFDQLSTLELKVTTGCVSALRKLVDEAPKYRCLLRKGATYKFEAKLQTLLINSAI